MNWTKDTPKENGFYWVKVHQYIEYDWEELNTALLHNKLFSTYNLLEKKKRTLVQFFQHPYSPGCPEPNSVSICLQQTEWEIFLNEDGTWCLR